MRKILIIADSMAMPRPNIAYEDTWPFKITQMFPKDHFIYRLQRSSSIKRLNTDGQGYYYKDAGPDCLEFYEPDLVILQLGITDCAPRHFTTKELKWLTLFNLIKPIRKWKNAHSYRKPQKALTPLNDFENEIEKYVKRAKQIKLKKLLIILIAPSTVAFRKISPKVQDQIEIYNNAFIQISQYNSFVECIEPLIASEMEECAWDEWHYNADGHNLVANRLFNSIS